MDENTLKQLVKLTQEGQLNSLEKQVTLGGSVALQTVSNKHFGRSGDTLLHYAARKGHLDIVEYLIKRVGVDVDVYNNDYKRPLHEAASMGHQECVSYLLHEGAKVDSLKKADWTPLMMACTRRNLSVIEELLSLGADPALRNKDGWNCFHIACREGDPLVIKRLLLIRPDVWRTESKTQRTPLHTAAMHGCEDVVSILLERCVYPPTVLTAVERLLSWTPLLLEKHQASPAAADGVGAQAVHQAAVTGQNEALRFLVKELNVDVNQRTTDIQLTALHYAAKEGHTSTIKTLLEFGADLHVRDTKGRTALHMALRGHIWHICTAACEEEPDVVQVFECGTPDPS
ncbi:hypothetical protein KUCAC02_037145 [Chaenocephalus aceratus]|nr:hypothetical protein KUCAC02_037145 [Chaenocephalus aceratus]